MSPKIEENPKQNINDIDIFNVDEIIEELDLPCDKLFTQVKDVEVTPQIEMPVVDLELAEIGEETRQGTPAKSERDSVELDKSDDVQVKSKV